MMQLNLKQQTILTQTNNFGRSGNYKLHNSEDLVRKIEAQGLKLKGVVVNKVRNAAKEGFQKHVLRFDIGEIDDQNRLELLAINSYDGTTSLELKLGIFRLVCENGLIRGSAFDHEAVRHIGDGFYHKVSESIERIVADSKKAKEVVLSMRDYKITDKEALELMINAKDIRLSEISGLNKANVLDLGIQRRQGDRNDDLWTTYNVIQENMIKGGMRYQTIGLDNSGNAALVNHSTKKISSITKQVDLNERLFGKAMELMNVAA